MVPIEQKICVKAPVVPEISIGDISEIVIGIIAVYIPMHAPWMILIIIKLSISVMYNNEPAINAVMLITKIKFLLEKT